MTHFPSPADFGAPAKFTSWRPGQDRVFERLIAARPGHKVAAMPTGTGKTLLGVAYASQDASRAVGITSTKGLQDQYATEMAGMTYDVRGMGNYPCLELGGDYMCDKGPCLDGDRCGYKDLGCHYFDRVREAMKQQIVITNYSFWFTRRANDPRMLGPRDLLIMDEAHAIPEELTNYLSISLVQSEIERWVGDWPGKTEKLSSWIGEGGWSEEACDRVKRLISQAGRSMRRRLKQVADDLERLGDINDSWVWEYVQGEGWRFEPLWPRDYARQWLWDGVPNTLFMSATVRPKHLSYLGIAEGEYQWFDCPSPFPIGRRPIYVVPCPNLKMGMDAADIGVWGDRIDDIIEGRLHWKGLIHTQSYERARWLKEHSRWSQYMLLPDKDNTAATVKQFKEAAAPLVLVSPSIHTGWDFAHDAARYQIIAKVPFPSLGSTMVRARHESDKEYLAFQAITKMEQAYGRGNRAMDDYCETFVVDGTIKRMLMQYKELWSPTFARAVKWVDQVPKAGRFD